MRLFYAITLDERIREALAGAMQNMRQCLAEGRLCPEENLHLTLVFLGETPALRLKAAREAMDAVHAAPFPLRVGGIGCFRREGGDIYWAGVERSQPLSNLYAALCGELKSRGFSVERREFRPHLTLVRQAILKSDCDRSVFAIPSMSMQADAVHLMLSERSAGRMVYTSLYSNALKKEIV